MLKTIISNIYIKKLAISTFIALFFMSLDRFLKMLAARQNDPTDLINGILKFNFAKNYYIAFSIPFTGIILNMLIILIMAILIYHLIKKIKEPNIYESSSLVFIILGSASNLFDRLRYGYVIDYIDLSYFTVFNIADAMIVCGVFFLIILTLKNHSDQ